MKKISCMLCLLSLIIGLVSFNLEQYALVFYLRLGSLFMMAFAAILYLSALKKQKHRQLTDGNEIAKNIIAFNRTQQLD